MQDDELNVGTVLAKIFGKLDVLNMKIDELKEKQEESNQALQKVKESIYDLYGAKNFNLESTIVTNARHYQALKKSHDDLLKVKDGMDNNITGDFLAMDIRQVLYHLGTITGEITTDDLLGNIFANFCIGK